MPGSDHFQPVRLVHVAEDVYHKAIGTPNLAQHRLRYGPKEVRGTRDKTGTTRDPSQGGDPDWLHYVPRPRKNGGKMYQHKYRRPSRQPLHVAHIQEDQPIPKSEILFNQNIGST